MAILERKYAGEVRGYARHPEEADLQEV